MRRDCLPTELSKKKRTTRRMGPPDIVLHPLEQAHQQCAPNTKPSGETIISKPVQHPFNQTAIVQKSLNSHQHAKKKN